MNRRILIGVVMILVANFLVVSSVSAQGMMGYRSGVNVTASNASVLAELQTIMKVQNINDAAKINCANVTDDQFEKLGDAYMGAGITEQQHAAMEQMMGGEGSATLKQAHINMGRSGLGCWASYNSNPWVMPMMGGSVPPYDQLRPSGPMMSGYYGAYAWAPMITMMLLWLVLLLGAAVLAMKLFKGKK